MRKLSVVAINPQAAIGKGDGFPEDQGFERFLGFVGQRPFFKPRAAERQLRSLNTHQPDLAAILEDNSVVIDHLHPACGRSGLEMFTQRCGNLGRGRGYTADHQQETEC